MAVINELLNKISTEFTPPVGADSLMETLLASNSAMENLSTEAPKVTQAYEALGSSWDADSSSLADLIRLETQQSEAQKSLLGGMMSTMPTGQYNAQFGMGGMPQDMPEQLQRATAAAAGLNEQEAYMAEALKNLINENGSLEESVKLLIASLPQLKAQIRAAADELVRSGQVVLGTSEATDKHTAALKTNSQEWRDNITTGRGARYAGLELIGMIQMMSVAFGDQLSPAMKELEKSAMLITSGGLASAMLGLSPYPGMLAAGFLALGISFLTVDEKVQNLNKSLDTMAKKDELTNTLAQVLDITKQDAIAMQDLAKSTPEVALALRDLVAHTEKMNGLQEAVSFLSEVMVIFTTKIGEANAQMKIFSDLQRNLLWGEKGAAALDFMQKNYEQHLQFLAAQDRLSLDIAKRQKEAAQDQLDNLKALKSETEKLAKDKQKAIDDEANAMKQGKQAYQSYTDSLANIEFSHNQQKIRDSQQYDAIRRSEDDAIMNAMQSRDDRMTDINRKTNEQLADADHNYQNEIARNHQQRVKDAQDLADNLADIERTRIEKLADLDFNTAIAISKAKTEHDVGDIQYKVMYERSVIDRDANDKREIALRQLDIQNVSLNKQLDDFTKAYNYRKEVIQRDATDQIQTTQRTYNEQYQAAIDSFAKQKKALDEFIAAQEKTYQHQKDDADKRYREDIGRIYEKTSFEIKGTMDSLAAFILSHNVRAYLLDQEKNQAKDVFSLLGGLMGGLSPVGVQASGQGAGVGSGNVSINVESIFKPIFQNLISQLNTSGAFRDGVRVVINDMVQQ